MRREFYRGGGPRNPEAGQTGVRDREGERDVDRNVSGEPAAPAGKLPEIVRQAMDIFQGSKILDSTSNRTR